MSGAAYDSTKNAQRVLVIGSSAAGSAIASEVEGPDADNAPQTGNPILVAGKYFSAQQTYADGDVADLQVDANGYLKVREQYAPSFEDNTNNVAKVEQRFTSSGAVTSDTTVKTGAGFCHTVTIAQSDAAPTAGTIDIYDNTAASGTKIFSWNLTTTVFMPFTVTLNVSVATGIYVDFTTTADVNVFISYR